MRILILGSTGYVGGRLVPRLLAAGHEVRCLVRDRNKALAREWADRVEIVEGDLSRAEEITPVLETVDVLYYLVHSMASSKENFVQVDRDIARAVTKAASDSSLSRIIYLGGLGHSDQQLSAHLRSRQEVGDILRTGSAKVTEFRAAVIVGSGSLSFELIHHLVNRLPVMTCPRWVYVKTQPIAIDDVLDYLMQALASPQAAGRTIDIGGPEQMSYRDMMQRVAEILGLKRWIIPVPLLTPRLSSYWINFVTPIRSFTARALIESLRYETVCEEKSALTMFDVRPMSFEKAAELALRDYRHRSIATNWTDAASSEPERRRINHSHLLISRQYRTVAAKPEAVYNVFTSLGGQTGWLFADWLWRIRGLLDQLVGGVGLRRGRRHPTKLAVGDALDFWRVAENEVNRKLLLRAEMRVWGEAWIEFKTRAIGENLSELVQTARYYPRGLTGFVYWYSIYPIHAWIFRGMARAIAKRAEKSEGGN